MNNTLLNIFHDLYTPCQTWSEYGNAMVAVISKIVVSSIAIVTTSISRSAIPNTESDFTGEKILSLWLCLVLPDRQLETLNPLWTRIIPVALALLAVRLFFLKSVQFLSKPARLQTTTFIFHKYPERCQLVLSDTVYFCLSCTCVFFVPAFSHKYFENQSE